MHKCAICGRSDIRLYREYGMFLRDEQTRCNAHLPDPPTHWGWCVPLVADTDGSVWGYTSAPDAALARWRALPDAAPSPVWDRGRWQGAVQGAS